MTIEIRQEDCRYVGTGKTSNDGGIDTYTAYFIPSLKLKVYLAGPITGRSYPEATARRNFYKAEFAMRGIECLDPMRDTEALRRRKKIQEPYPEDEPLLKPRAIMGRDLNDIESCDLILADFEGTDHVSSNSMFELGYATHARKPFILVMESKGNRNDATFPNQSMITRTDDKDEAVRLACSILNVEYEVNSAE